MERTGFLWRLENNGCSCLVLVSSPCLTTVNVALAGLYHLNESGIFPPPEDEIRRR